MLQASSHMYSVLMPVSAEARHVIWTPDDGELKRMWPCNGLRRPTQSFQDRSITVLVTGMQADIIVQMTLKKKGVWGKGAKGVGEKETANNTIWKGVCYGENGGNSPSGREGIRSLQGCVCVHASYEGAYGRVDRQLSPMPIPAQLELPER